MSIIGMRSPLIIKKIRTSWFLCETTTEGESKPIKV